MPHRKPRVTLIHNPSAGNGEHGAEDLVRAVEHGGYSVWYVSSKKGRIGEVLNRPCDLVAIAGGDGTIRKVATIARPDGPPLAILPLGTANNIAKSLGIEGSPDYLAGSWKRAAERAYYPIKATGEWGCRRLVEGIGFGAIVCAIGSFSDCSLDPADARRRFGDFIMEAEPIEISIDCDGVAMSGAFVAVEITNIPLVGPNLLLAPAADPSDRRIEIRCVPAGADERRRFTEWLINGGSDPSPAWICSGARLSIAGRLTRVRLDDKPRKVRGESEISVISEPDPLRFLV